MSRATDLVKKLALQPHPEGGWYREIYRSPTRVDTARGSRAALTTIYYLLERNQLSRWHVVQADELWHFYGGAPLELLDYNPTSRKLTRHVLGYLAANADTEGEAAPAAAAALHGAIGSRDVSRGDISGATSVAVIPTGVWQAARSLGDYTLVGCTVGPGFEFADFQFVSALPAHADHFTGELSQLAALL
jgi:predicted cupin superfamily sugar epimerase